MNGTAPTWMLTVGVVWWPGELRWVLVVVEEGFRWFKGRRN
jgi:hypothetical protein